MRMTLTCNYCNFKWIKYVYSTGTLKEKCDKCGDTNIKYTKYADESVDYYVGCPKFKESDNDDTDYGF